MKNFLLKVCFFLVAALFVVFYISRLSGRTPQIDADAVDTWPMKDEESSGYPGQIKLRMNLPASEEDVIAFDAATGDSVVIHVETEEEYERHMEEFRKKYNLL